MRSIDKCLKIKTKTMIAVPLRALSSSMMKQLCLSFKNIITKTKKHFEFFCGKQNYVYSQKYGFYCKPRAAHGEVHVEETGAAQGCTTASSSSSSSSSSSNSLQDNCDYGRMLSASHLVYYFCQPSLYRLQGEDAGIFNDSGLEQFLRLNFSDCDVPRRLENDQVENFFFSKRSILAIASFTKSRRG